MDWLNLLAVQGTLKSLLQKHQFFGAKLFLWSNSLLSPLSVLVLFTEGRPLGEENIFKSTSRSDGFSMAAMAEGLATSPFISLWAKAHWLPPHVVLGWGFVGREEGLSATDRKRHKRGGDGGGERDTIWVSRTESQQCQTKIERKGRLCQNFYY